MAANGRDTGIEFIQKPFDQRVDLFDADWSGGVTRKPWDEIAEGFVSIEMSGHAELSGSCNYSADVVYLE